MTEKVIFATTLDDQYVPGFLVTLSSILDSTNKFDYPICIIEWGKLSSKNKQYITNLYPNVFFKAANLNLYKQQFDSSFRVWNYNCNIRYEIFDLGEVDRVVYFDTDILFQIDVKEILKYKVDFGACIMPNINFFNQTVNKEVFNAGLMSISKRFLNQETKQHLLDLASSEPIFSSNITSNLWVGNQPILNNFFAEFLTPLPDKFNFLIDRFTLDCTKTGSKNFHYIGHKKPWINDTNLQTLIDPYVVNHIKNNYPNNLILQRLALRRVVDLYQTQIKKLLIKNPNLSDHFK